jgi:recombination protein RecR
LSYTLPLARLIEAFQKLPGIGPKSAQRLAFHLLKMSEAEVQQFAHILLEAKEKIGYCEVCYNLSSHSPCEICAHSKRNRFQICVVAEPRDLYALERTGEFTGLYHVLGGLISPMEGIGPETLKVKELIQRLSQLSLSNFNPFSEQKVLTPLETAFESTAPASFPASSQAVTAPHDPIQEIILALPPSIEGDTTSLYLAKLIKPLEIPLTRIAFGLPVGGDLEYADNLTISRALIGRQAV